LPIAAFQLRQFHASSAASIHHIWARAAGGSGEELDAKSKELLHFLFPQACQPVSTVPFGPMGPVNPFFNPGGFQSPYINPGVGFGELIGGGKSSKKEEIWNSGR
jgi:hypothetical protein